MSASVTARYDAVKGEMGGDKWYGIPHYGELVAALAKFKAAGITPLANAGNDHPAGHRLHLEVGKEGVPLLIRRGPVLLAGAERTTAGDERPVGLDGVRRVDRVVTHRGVDVGVTCENLRDVGRQAAADRVGDEDPPEVVRREAEGLPGGVGEPGPLQDLVDALADQRPGHRCELAAVSPLEQQRHRRVPDLLCNVVAGQHRDRACSGGADAGDDRAEDVGQFRSDQEKPFLVGFRKGDLEQRHDLTGRGQFVLNQGVMAGLQHLLDPDAGVLKELDRVPGPERPLLDRSQVDASAGLVVGPERSRRVLLLARAGPASERELAAEWSGPQGVHPLLGLDPILPGGPDHSGQRGQPFAGALVHLGLAAFFVLGGAGVCVTDGAGGATQNSVRKRRQVRDRVRPQTVNAKLRGEGYGCGHGFRR